jgi:hypothetical protein
MFGEEVLLEIDSTLDQLIRNAEVIHDVDLKSLSETEIDAFQKTQESLLQHLIRMDHFLETKRKDLKVQNKRSASYKIQEKLLKFERLKSDVEENLIRTTARKTPILSKRRGKRFFSDRFALAR